ncbi:unnamed protein product [Fusarium graminearum]|nr:unnamed protein product [Fusarium graminearum]VTO90291.1 unnamed protein product [Fusarium graminearum]
MSVLLIDNCEETIAILKYVLKDEAIAPIKIEHRCPRMEMKRTFKQSLLPLSMKITDLTSSFFRFSPLRSIERTDDFLWGILRVSIIIAIAETLSAQMDDLATMRVSAMSNVMRANSILLHNELEPLRGFKT